MAKQVPKKKETDIDTDKRIKELEEKVLLLEVENEYLKKLKALGEQKRISKQKKKLESFSKSSKAKNTKEK